MKPVMRRIPDSTAYAFIHPCSVCGDFEAHHGEGVSLLKGNPGVWFCRPCLAERNGGAK